ncbi:Dihydrolipoamide acetyltransferase component of pyruvate dehydrogenase complex, partial [hydrothermal vent metagenome]
MSNEIIKVPDIGDVSGVEVIEILVAVGDTIEKEDVIVTLESEKATLEVPTSTAGVVKKIVVNIGDEVAEGSPLLEIEALTAAPTTKTNQKTIEKKVTKTPKKVVTEPAPVATKKTSTAVVNTQRLTGTKAHASPAIRKFARELGADINRIPGSGRKGRITKEDVKTFIKQAIQAGGSTASSVANFEVLPPPDEDFSKFGAVETVALSRIQKISGKYLHRNWVRIPHVTQFDESDITDMEEFRQANKVTAKAQGFSLSPLAFILKAVAVALRKFPNFNASLDASGKNLVLKKYYHIGIAVDTPNGLVVPVLRDVLTKTVMEIAQEMGAISLKARDGKLTPSDMKGGCFTVSSLGGIGGT